jgi:hypothetical protein
MTNWFIGNVEEVGPGHIWLGNGADKCQINFADDWAITKEDCAAAFCLGKPVAVSVGERPFVGVDFLPGVFEALVIPSSYPVASVERRSVA